MRTRNRVGAIIIRDGRMLMIHRRKLGDEYWVLVGGGVEEGEDIEEALKREVKEETSRDVIKAVIVDEGEDKDHKHLLFEVLIDQGEVSLGGPEQLIHSEDNWYNLEWVDLKDLSSLKDVYPAKLLETVKRYI